MTEAFDYVKRYLVAFIAAVALHATIVSGLQFTLMVTEQARDKFVIEPKPLRAQLVRLKTQRPVAPEQPSPANLPSDESNKDANKDLEVEARETEEEQLERLREEREKRLEELRDRAFRDSLGEELTAEMADAVQDLSQVYVTRIYLAIVESWSRPPSARNDMSCVILVELFPTGDLNSVGVLESSGNAAFDRSALNAVRRAAPFEVPTDLDLFESSFRSFRLNFSPEDLLR